MSKANKQDDVLISSTTLEQFVFAALRAIGVAEEKAMIVADVMVSASLRGVDSHGVNLLPWYMTILERGLVSIDADPQILFETGSMLVVDAQNSLGAPVSKMAMSKCLELAQTSGIACATVRNSNHFGMAAYYAMQALPHDMIGLAMTNASRLVAPTFGVEPMLGTNPIAMAAPAGDQSPFVLDMATSVIPFGKASVADKRGELLPAGVAIDQANEPLLEPSVFIRAVRENFGAALLPLGTDAALSSYKGYGLAMLVDILSGVLSGSSFSKHVGESPSDPANIGHWFMAINIRSFMEIEDFRARMDLLFGELKSSRKAIGQSRIYIPGEIEFEREAVRAREGIPVDRRTVSQLEDVAAKVGVEFTY